MASHAGVKLITVIYMKGRLNVQSSAIRQSQISHFQDESHVGGTVAWKSNGGSSKTQLG